MNEDNNLEGKICVCSRCESQINCLTEQVPVNNLLPEWFGNGTCYEKQDDGECPVYSRQIQTYDYRVFMIKPKREIGFEYDCTSDPITGRLAAKLITIDLLRGQEVELKLCPSVDQFDSLSREEMCSLWPGEYIPINHHWATLSLFKGTYHHTENYTLWLIEMDFAEGKFTPKHSVALWDRPGFEVYCFGYKNLMNEIGMPIRAFIINNTHHEDNHTRVTKFIGFDQKTQKLEVMRQVEGLAANWAHCIMYACLNGRELNAFRCDSLDGTSHSWVLNLAQLRIYSMDNHAEGLQVKELKSPVGFEHEIGQRRAHPSEVWRFGWSANKCTVCLKSPPPYRQKFNMFVLDLEMLEWRHLNVEEALPTKYYRHLINAEEMYSEDGDKLILHGTHRVYKDSKWNEVQRFHRIHLGKPATLIELTYQRSIKLKSQKSQYIDEITEKFASL